MAVRADNKLSDFFFVNRGLRHGCPLSPLLFIATFKKICERIEQQKMGFPLDPETFINQIAFADDGTLLGMNHDEISNLLAIFDDACRELGLKRGKDTIYDNRM